MKKVEKKIVLTAMVAALAMPLPSHAGGGGFSGVALETTQLLNHAELVSIYASEIEQLTQQIQMYMNMVQNTINLPIQMWSSINAELNRLVNAISNVMGVVNATEDAMARIEQQFGSGEILSNYRQRIRDWTFGVNRQIGTALQNMGLNASQFTTRQQALESIQRASQSAEGRMKVLQAGNQIAGLMVNELQALHGTIISAEQARLNAIAVDENDKYQQRMALEHYLSQEFRGGF